MAGKKIITMNNKMNAPIPIPGIQFVAGFENKGVDVGVRIIVLVGEGTVAVGVAVKVDVGVNVTIAVSVGVEVCVTVAGIGVLVRRSSFSGSDVAGHGIGFPAASKQAACALAFMDGVNRIVENKTINRRRYTLILVTLPPGQDIPSSLILQNVMDQIAHLVRSAHRYGLSCLRLAIHLSPHHKFQPMLLRNFFCFCLPCQ